ncbi:MAG: glycosyltransferase [Ruminococcaceae bacterium]|nr:glycosyltransferase [Oscillospiraceae bacterium]
MKSVLFLMRYPLEEAYNLKQKFDGQMQAVVNLGYRVFHFAYDQKNIYLVNVNEGTRERVASTTFGGFGRYRSTLGFYDLFKCLCKVQKKQHFDYIYMRQKVVGRAAISAFKNHKNSGGKLIVEIPSYGSVEQSLSLFRTIVKKVLDSSAKKLPQYVDLFTIIGTDDLTEYNGKKALCISNGVCVENYPLHKKRLGNDIHILALASMRDWQGFDRLVTGLAAYKGETPVYIEMVGGDDDGSLEKWKNLAQTLGVSQNITFHGALYGEALNEVVEKCDIGAATLGLHRKQNGGNASVLKVREYTARGIPFICAYNDSALNGDESFVLQIDRDDSPVDIARVVDWTQSLYEKTGLKEEIRDFAEAKMSWESQFKKILGE